MAGKNRRSSSNIDTAAGSDAQRDIKSDLLSNGRAFSFFQVMRLLRLLETTKSTVPGSDSSENGNIRVKPKLSLAFPSSDVDRVEEKVTKEGSSFNIIANFLGLYGVSSPLPTFYTEDILSEDFDDQTVSRDFIDIINHRIYELFFKCVTKYRQAYQVVEDGNKDHIQRLYSLVGLGEDKLRENIPESYCLLRYIGLFTQFPRSAMGLKTLIQDALGEIPVEVVPCIGRYVKIPEDQMISLGLNNGVLGTDSFLGEEIEDKSGKFRLMIGPMNKKNFLSCSPGNEGFKKFVFLTNLYMVDPLDYDIELIMKQDQKKTTCLGDTNWSSLGVNTWIFAGKDKWESRSIVFPDS
jgi:type VI secretion system protein ImpH